MPFYLFQARYTTEAIKAMVNNPQDREAAARPLIEALGGKLHNLFFCFGADDVMAIIEAPDDEAMAACALTVAASGAFSGGATTKLMTSGEAMAAMKSAQKATASYTPATG
ncbi:MAG: GYD domain-containing protein [Litoreibacter sp.]|nr:GYD domain-containing protein [Litoreibacter sp.]